MLEALGRAALTANFTIESSALALMVQQLLWAIEL
jgi:hypothetical protein